MWEGARELFESFSSPSKACTSKSQHLVDNISTDEFGEDTNIQSVTRTYSGRKTLKSVDSILITRDKFSPYWTSENSLG